MYANFREIIDLWPTRRIMAQDLEDYLPPDKGGSKITGTMVADWYRRDHFQPRFFEALIRAMHKRGFKHITYEDLSRLYRERRKRAAAQEEK